MREYRNLFRSISSCFRPVFATNLLLQRARPFTRPRQYESHAVHLHKRCTGRMPACSHPFNVPWLGASRVELLRLRIQIYPPSCNRLQEAKMKNEGEKGSSQPNVHMSGFSSDLTDRKFTSHLFFLTPGAVTTRFDSCCCCCCCLRLSTMSPLLLLRDGNIAVLWIEPLIAHVCVIVEVKPPLGREGRRANLQIANLQICAKIDKNGARDLYKYETTKQSVVS